jgi:hypothetical protein
MRTRCQGGYLRLGRRKTGPDCWEFLWRDTDPTGRRVRRMAVIGTVQESPTVEHAWQASNGLRVSINETRNRQREQAITVGDPIDVGYPRLSTRHERYLARNWCLHFLRDDRRCLLEASVIKARSHNPATMNLTAVTFMALLYLMGSAGYCTSPSGPETTYLLAIHGRQ